MNNFLKQSLTGLWKKIPRDDKRGCRFEEIVGHDDIKSIFVKAILSTRPVHVLLVGPPGSAKTMFLTEIMRHHKASCFVVGSNATKAGLVNQLFERRPKFLLIDELEKMSFTDQTSLLHLMETGIISETKFNKTRQTELTSWVFATANSYKKIIQLLLSRFAVLEVPEYTFDEFTDIAISRLSKENIDERNARVIAEKVWYELDSRDIRDIIQKTKNLVICTYPTRDLDRMLSFYLACKESGRSLVIDLKQAYILKLFNQSEFLKDVYPSPKDNVIKIYKPRKSWGLIDKDVNFWTKKVLLGDYDNWADEFIDYNNSVNHRDVSSNQKEMVFYCSDFQLQELIDVRPKVLNGRGFMYKSFPAFPTFCYKIQHLTVSYI